MTRLSPLVYLFAVILLLFPVSLLAQANENTSVLSASKDESTDAKYADFTIRLGMGGFNDSRSPVGKLGGDQLALDIKSVTLPIAISLTSEYYTNSANPTHSYEIAGLYAVNLLYVDKLPFFKTANYFAGGGSGWLEVKASEINPDKRVRSYLFNLEVGVHVRAFWKIGVYGAVKYLYAQKKVDNLKLVDFNEAIFLIGVTYNFSL